MRIDDYPIIGEPALDGRVRAGKGAPAAVMLAERLGKRGAIVPPDNAAEAAVVEGINVIAARFLTDAAGFLTGEPLVEPTVVDLDEVFRVASRYTVDFSDVRGQESAEEVQKRLREMTEHVGRARARIGQYGDLAGEVLALVGKDGAVAECERLAAQLRAIGAAQNRTLSKCRMAARRLKGDTSGDKAVGYSMQWSNPCVRVEI